MAAKAPGGKKRPRRKRKLRLTLRQNKIKKADSYTDSLGWSTDVGRTLEDAPKAAEPETINIQCDMCGSMLKIKKTYTSKIFRDMHISRMWKCDDVRLK